MFPQSTALFFLVAAAAASACPTVDANRAADEVRAAFLVWDDAVVHKNLDKAMAIFSPTIHFQFQGAADFGYAHLRSIYQANFTRENAPVWRPTIEGVIASPELVNLFSDWKLVPATGGAPVADYRGVDVFQRDADCVWSVTASLNYADKAVTNDATPRRTIGPAQVRNDPTPSSGASIGSATRISRSP